MEFQNFLHYKFKFSDLIGKAFHEDLPYGDITTEALGVKYIEGKAKLVAKEDLILSGIDLLKEAFLWQEPDTEFRFHFEDGQRVLKSQVICEMKGNLLNFLKAERVALNFVGTLSGIASFTRCFVDLVSHTDTKILDTRKTLPLYRDFFKKAVVDGGGTNHRMNLSDGIMIKENHIRAAGNLKNAVQKVRSNSQKPIEVETTNLDEVKLAVALGVERIMLDNMTNDQMSMALDIIPEHIEVEASGNMNLERVKSVAELGVDFISIGAITHSAPAADISLQFVWN
ncbi:MAG: carboxylating nicotinate-nucleotide diphosphorylase [Bdellovibrionales bacterium]|nr:carboxylating nicotinate-nucleotide diphosphorylase [Bdellovibrionales bacterium]